MFNSCAHQSRRLQASVIRAALPCLSHVLAALDPADWPSATQPFTLLLRFCIDARPKVRRRAQSGLVDVLAAVQRTVAIDNASALVLKGASTPTSLGKGTHPASFTTNIL